MKKWKLNPQVRSLSSSGPRMLALIALPLIKKFGDEAKQVITKIMFQEGLKKGKRLASKAKDRNDLIEFERLNVEEYEKQGTNTPGFDDPARKWLIKSKHLCSYNLSLAGGCEMMIPQVWEEMGLSKEEIKLLGEIYCIPYDTGVREGFNPKIKFKFTKLVTRGDPYCEWYEEIIK